MNEQITEFLNGKEFVNTKEISRGMFGMGATKKMINKYLYAMEREGKLVKECDEDGTKPRWKLCQ